MRSARSRVSASGVAAGALGEVLVQESFVFSFEARCQGETGSHSLDPARSSRSTATGPSTPTDRGCRKDHQNPRTSVGALPLYLIGG